MNRLGQRLLKQGYSILQKGRSNTNQLSKFDINLFSLFNKNVFSFSQQNEQNNHEILIENGQQQKNSKKKHEKSQPKEIVIKSNLDDDIIDSSVYDKEFEKANDVFVEDDEIVENITHTLDENDKEHPYIFQTKYGRVKYVQTPLSLKLQSQITKAYYLHNTMSSNFIRKIMKEDQTKSLLIFSQNTNYNNVNQTFSAVKKMVEEFYYGTENRPKNPFRKCTSPEEIYNLSRRIAIEQKNFLSRICILVSHNGQLRIKGQNVPSSQLLSQHLGKQQEGAIEKHDFLIPFQHWQGIHSAEQYESNGIPIPQLNGKKVYPVYGVWPPTQQHYLKLLYQYLQDSKNYLRGVEKVCDLGCGSGILSFIIAEAAPDVKITCLDKYEAAVRCTGMNAAILSLSARIRNEIFDITEKQKNNNLVANLEKLKLDTSYDLIIANPPWITASPLTNDSGLEAANYDQKEEMLRSSFKFAQECLNKENKKSRKGRFLLIYSDLSENLGIQVKDRIQQLCEQHQMIISDKKSVKLAATDLYRKNDPNYGPKSISSVILYEITRV
ncbi:hypothetical protein ABPG74_018556 [Tetrahymena malaccensis]